MATSETRAVETNCVMDMVVRVSRAVGRISCSRRGPLRNMGQTKFISTDTSPLSPPARSRDTEPTLASGTDDFSRAIAASMDRHNPPWTVKAVRSTVAVKVIVGDTQLFIAMRCQVGLSGVPYHRKKRKQTQAATIKVLIIRVNIATVPVRAHGEGGGVVREPRDAGR